MRVEKVGRVWSVPPGVNEWRGVVGLGGAGRWSGEDSRVEEELLQCIEFVFEENNIEGCIVRAEGIFDEIRDERMFEHSSVRSFGLIITTGEFASGADFFLEFHDREKEVVEEAKAGIELV